MLTLLGSVTMVLLVIANLGCLLRARCTTRARLLELLMSAAMLAHVLLAERTELVVGLALALILAAPLGVAARHDRRDPREAFRSLSAIAMGALILAHAAHATHTPAATGPHEHHAAGGLWLTAALVLGVSALTAFAARLFVRQRRTADRAELGVMLAPVLVMAAMGLTA